MAWNDEAATVVAGTGQLYVAPVGTTLPAVNSDPEAALPSEWVGLGYTTEDGVTLGGNLEISEHRVWQNTSPVRRERRSQELEITCELVQWDENTLLVAFGGGSTSTGGGFTTYTFPAAGEALYERAVVLDLVDGERVMRLVVARMNVADSVETQFNADNMAVLPVSLRSLASTTTPYLISNDAAAFAAGS